VCYRVLSCIVAVCLVVWSRDSFCCTLCPGLWYLGFFALSQSEYAASQNVNLNGGARFGGVSKQNGRPLRTDSAERA
jgi:hypothetical protein